LLAPREPTSAYRGGARRPRGRRARGWDLAEAEQHQDAEATSRCEARPLLRPGPRRVERLQELGRERAPLALGLVFEGRIVVELAAYLVGAHAARLQNLRVDVDRRADPRRQVERVARA